MARTYSACLGCIALVICIVRGLLLNVPIDSILNQSLVTLLALSTVGFVLGSLAESIIRQSVEANFRQAVQKLREKLGE